MPNDKLILRTLPSQYGDVTRNSVLSHQDVDENFIYLKGLDIFSATSSNNVITLYKRNGEILNFNLSGGAFTDTYISSGVFNNNVLTLQNNTGGTVSISGITGGGVSNSTSITGGTFSNGVLSLTNSTGGTVSVSGITGGSAVDTLVTGGTYNNGVLSLTNSTGGTFNVSGFATDDISLTGGTYNNGVLLLSNSTGGTFSVSGFPTADVSVTGGSYNNGVLLLSNSTGGTFSISGFSSGDTFSGITTQDTTSISLFGDGMDTTPLSSEVNISSTLNNGLLLFGDGLYVPNTIRNGVLTGGVVVWYSGYTYEISAASYYIDNNFYTSPARTVAGGNAITLLSADTTNPRVDVFYVDTNSSTNALTGISSPSPEKPSVDNNTQIELSFAIVGPNTTGATVTQTQIYFDNNGEPTEWTALSNSPRINVDSTVTPIDSTKSIEATLSVAGDTILLTNDIPVTIANQHTLLTFKIRPKALVGNTNSKRLRLSFRLAGSVIGNSINLSNGSYGLNISSVTTQTISIPLSAFGLLNTSNVDNLFIENISTGGNSMGFFIDDIKLQGVPVPITPSLTDTVVTGGTYTAGTATFRNNTGGTFTVTGFTNGGTIQGLQDVLTVDSILTGDNIIDQSGTKLTFDLLSAGTVGGSVVFDGSLVTAGNVQDPTLSTRFVQDDNFSLITSQSAVSGAKWDYLRGQLFKTKMSIDTNGFNIESRVVDASNVPVGFSSGMYSGVFGGEGENGIFGDNFYFEINGSPSAAGYVLTDVNGDGYLSLQPTSGGSVSDPFWIEVTKSQADTLISNSTLIKGAKYKIANVDPTLYGGTDVVLTAVANNKFSLEGTGIFYNPKYNQSLDTYGIWTNTSTWVTSSVVGNFNANEVVTANNGAVGTLFSVIDANRFIVTSGDFSTATSITGNTTLATANIASVNVRTYAINDTVIWGGLHWSNISGLVGTSTSLFVLDTNWSATTYNNVDYNVSLDAILYDYENDLIVRRQDKNGNVVEASKATVTIWSNPRTIALFQWGNPYVESTFKGCGNNQVINGYVDNINMIGCFAHNVVTSKAYFLQNRFFNTVVTNNLLSNGSNISTNTLTTGGINNNILTSANSNNNPTPSVISGNIGFNSWINANKLELASTINNNLLNSGCYIYNNYLTKVSAMNANILRASSFIFGNDLFIGSSINSNTLFNACYLYNNTVGQSSTITSNILNAGSQGYIHNNKITQSSTINSNSIVGVIANNVLEQLCNINSNTLTVTNSQIRENFVKQTSTINGNTLNRWAFIRGNTVELNSTINSNVIQDNPGDTHGNYIWFNRISTGEINSNTISGDGLNYGIAGNTLMGVNYASSQITAFRSKINSNTVTTSLIANNDLYYSEILNFAGNSTCILTKNKYRNTTANYTGITPVRSLDGQNIDNQFITYNHTITFNGAAGTGAIGDISLPPFIVPVGYFIEEVLVDITTPLVGVGAKINLGISVDNLTSGLNNTTGDISTLNTGVITKISTSTFTKSAGSRVLIASVNTAAITSGTGRIMIKLSKL